MMVSIVYLYLLKLLLTSVACFSALCLPLVRPLLGSPSLIAPSFHTTFHKAIPPFQQVELTEMDSQSPSRYIPLTVTKLMEEQ